MAGIPEYLFDIIPQRNDLYNTHLNNSRTDIFKYFFPIYNIRMEQNRQENRTPTTMLSFRNALLIIGQSTPKPIDNIYDLNDLTLQTRLDQLTRQQAKTKDKKIILSYKLI